MPVQIPIFGGGQIVGGQGVRPMSADWGPADVSQSLQQGIGSLYNTYRASANERNLRDEREKMAAAYEEGGPGARAAALGAPGGPYGPPAAPGTGYNTGGRVPSFTALPNKGVSADFKPLFENGEQQYALPPGTLGTLAFLESKFNPSAKNPGSSAGGLFQFVDRTAKQYGLTDRYDPVAATDAAGRLAQDNARQLQQVLGRMPTVGEIYLAHQQGGTGAARLLTNPDARAVDIVGEAAVRKNGGRVDMTAGEFAGLWTNKASAAHRGLYGNQQPPPQAQPAVAPGPGGNQPVRNAQGQQMTFEEQVAAAKAAGLPPPVMPSAANPNPQPQVPPNPTPVTNSSQPLFPGPSNQPPPQEAGPPPNQAQAPQPIQMADASGQVPIPIQTAQTMAPGGAGGGAGPGGPMQMPPGTNEPPPPVTQAPPQPGPFVPGGPAPGPGIGVNPDGSRDTTGPNGETISPNPPAGRQPPPSAAPATPTPPVQTAGPGVGPAGPQPGGFAGVPPLIEQMTPRHRKMMAAAIRSGDNGLVQQAGALVAQELGVGGKQTQTQEINGVLYEKDPRSGRWLPVAGAGSTKAPTTVELDDGRKAQWDGSKWVPITVEGGAAGGAKMFPGNSVEAAALNHMVETGRISKEQAADLATGKAITTPDGTFFLRGSELIGVGAGGAGGGAGGGSGQPGVQVGGAKPQVLPAEVAGRIGLANEFLDNGLPEVRKWLDDGGVTLTTRAGIATGRGIGGDMARTVERGREALLRNLTGAGMGVEEAKTYAQRYSLGTTDFEPDMRRKLNALEKDLRAARDAQLAGRKITNKELTGSDEKSSTKGGLKKVVTDDDYEKLAPGEEFVDESGTPFRKPLK